MFNLIQNSSTPGFRVKKISLFLGMGLRFIISVRLYFRVHKDGVDLFCIIEQFGIIHEDDVHQQFTVITVTLNTVVRRCHRLLPTSHALGFTKRGTAWLRARHSLWSQVTNLNNHSHQHAHQVNH
jgi:hypothetical protein